MLHGMSFTLLAQCALIPTFKREHVALQVTSRQFVLGRVNPQYLDAANQKDAVAYASIAAAFAAAWVIGASWHTYMALILALTVGLEARRANSGVQRKQVPTLTEAALSIANAWDVHPACGVGHIIFNCWIMLPLWPRFKEAPWPLQLLVSVGAVFASYRNAMVTVSYFQSRFQAA